MSCYLGGLEEVIQLDVRMFNPTTIQQAHCLAKLQEAVHQAIKPKTQPKPLPPLLPTPKHPTTNLDPLIIGEEQTPTHKIHKQKFNQTSNPNRKTLTAKEMSDKRAKGLFFGVMRSMRWVIDVRERSLSYFTLRWKMMKK